MKTIAARELQQRLRETIEAAQRELVVVTRHGRPVATIRGLEGKSWPQVLRLARTPAARPRRRRRAKRRRQHLL